MTPTFGRWDTDDLGEVQPTLSSVREMIVDRFTATHGPRFGETRAALGLDHGENAVRSSVEGIVRLAFTLAGGSYEHPTIATTTRVVNLLAERSVSWGVAEDEIFAHHCEMMRALGCVYLACEVAD